MVWQVKSGFSDPQGFDGCVASISWCETPGVFVLIFIRSVGVCQVKSGFSDPRGFDGDIAGRLLFETPGVFV